MERNGIIVKRDGPTDWVSSMLIVEKKDKSIRICIDPRDLNTAIQREHFLVPTFDDILPRLSGKKLFSIIDMKDGFWHIELDDESSKLVTFNTPFGRYSFRRLPFGITSAPEVFQKRVYQAFGDIEGVSVIFDDIIIAADTVEQHDTILKQLLQRARELNVRFNKEKLQLLLSSVVYLGHRVSEKGISADEEKVRAIVQFPAPTSKEELLRFNGMVTYVSRYIPNFADISFPYRQLLKKDVPWNWAEAQQAAFDKLKCLITNAPVLSHYDQSKPLVIQTDASSKGLGSCLLQDGHPICFASRALSDCETRYAQIEKELLAIVFACEKFHMYIYGREILVQSDHRPLESLFKKTLTSTTPRLQRMLLRLTRYYLNVQYTPGKLMYIADALSRAYLPETDVTSELADELDVAVHAVLFNFSTANAALEEIKTATVADPILSQLIKILKEGIPLNTASFPSELKSYRAIIADLYEVDGIVCKNERIIIPSSMREKQLRKLHAGHLGIEKTKRLARQYYYWPGIEYDIEVHIRKCATCNAHRRKQTKEPIRQHPIPDNPWQKVGCDIFTSRGKDHLIVVDYFSKFIEVCKLEAKTAAAVIRALEEMFSRHGVPETVMADNVPFASREFLKFAELWNFRVVTSSPNYPQSNGQAERAIQTVKSLMIKAHETNQSVWKALLHFRSTPISGTDISPAQALFGRNIRTDLATAKSVKHNEQIQATREQLVAKQKIERYYADKSSRSLPPLKPGDSIRFQLGEKLMQGMVLHPIEGVPRTYKIVAVDGSVYRRNRRHLVRSCEDVPHIELPGQNWFASHNSNRNVIVNPSAVAQDQQQEQQPTETPEPIHPPSPPPPPPPSPPVPILIPPSDTNPSLPSVSDPVPPVPQQRVAQTPIRRSGRNRRPPQRYSPS